MQNPIPDERYSVADEAILGAFFKLIKQKAPDRITVSDITKTAGIARSTLTICRYTMENPFLASLLSTPHGNDLFEKMLTMLHHYVTATTSSARPDRHTKEEISYVITCAIGSTIGVLHKWTRDDFDLAPEVIAEILTQIFLAGMLPLLS